MRQLLLATTFAACMMTTSCKGFLSPNVVNGILDVEQIACVIAASVAGASDVGIIAQVCSIAQPVTQDVINAINSIVASKPRHADPKMLATVKPKLAALKKQGHKP